MNFWAIGFLGIAVISICLVFASSHTKLHPKSVRYYLVIAAALLAVGNVLESFLLAAFLDGLHNPYWIEIIIYDGIRLAVELAIFVSIISLSRKLGYTIIKPARQG